MGLEQVHTYEKKFMDFEKLFMDFKKIHTFEKCF